MADELRPLIERCLARDQAAMLEFVERYQSRVFGLCYRMLGHRQDAEDAAQETFHRALKSLAQWDAGRDFEPWLLAIAGNRCRTALAARMRRPVPQAILDPLPDNTPDLQAARNLAEEVELALERVREEYRRAFMLFHDQELSYAEIGKVLSVPLGTVKTWVHRARRELIEYLSQRGVVREQRTGASTCNAKSLKLD